MRLLEFAHVGALPFRVARPDGAASTAAGTADSVIRATTTSVVGQVRILIPLRPPNVCSFAPVGRERAPYMLRTRVRKPLRESIRAGPLANRRRPQCDGAGDVEMRAPTLMCQVP